MYVHAAKVLLIAVFATFALATAGVEARPHPDNLIAEDLETAAPAAAKDASSDVQVADNWKKKYKKLKKKLKKRYKQRRKRSRSSFRFFYYSTPAYNRYSYTPGYYYGGACASANAYCTMAFESNDRKYKRCMKQVGCW